MQRYYLDECPSSSNQNLIVHKYEKKCWIWSAIILQFRDHEKDDNRKILNASLAFLFDLASDVVGLSGVG